MIDAEVAWAKRDGGGTVFTLHKKLARGEGESRDRGSAA
jgi:hypothetical protein